MASRWRCMTLSRAALRLTVSWRWSCCERNGMESQRQSERKAAAAAAASSLKSFQVPEKKIAVLE